MKNKEQLTITMDKKVLELIDRERTHELGNTPRSTIINKIVRKYYEAKIGRSSY